MNDQKGRMYLKDLDCGRQSNIHDLHTAISAGWVSHTQDILQNKSIGINTTVRGSTALSLTLYKDNNELLQLILALTNANVDQISTDDRQHVEPPLVTACRMMNFSAVQLLLSHGASLESVDCDGHSALWMATRQRSLKTCQLLLQCGANVSPSNIWTHSPLYFAISYSSKRTKIARLLIVNGADVHVRRRASLVYLAIFQGCADIAQLLYDVGCRIDDDSVLREQLMGKSLTSDRVFAEWLLERCRNPRCLLNIACIAIRREVSRSCGNRYFLQHLKHLPLPLPLLNILCLT